MVAVNDIRFKRVNSILEYSGKHLFIFPEIFFGKVAKSGTFIRHDITHTGNMEGNIRMMEIHKHGFVWFNTVCVITGIRANTRNQIIIIATSGCFPNHRLNIYTTAS